MIIHIDMDAFYASVEQLDNPELRGKCVIVGGASNRGVVSAASYEARKFGVHSAMPIFQAKEKCPTGVFVPPRIARYKEISVKIMSILREFTPLVEPVSIDEAYMDISGCEMLHGSPHKIAEKLKIRIKSSVDLTCSVGLAPTKFLAKIASDMDKPDGLTIITQGRVQPFIESLPIRKVPGVGAMTHKKLDAMGIKTLGDVRCYSETVLFERLGKFGKRLVELAAGVDSSPVVPTSEHKSVSTETTLGTDTTDRKLLAEYLLRQSVDVAKQLRKLEVMAKTITLKIKHADFKQVTRSTTLSIPTRSSKSIYAESVRLLGNYSIKKKIRLIGVGTSGLACRGTPVQIGMFDGATQKGDRWEKVDRAVDSIAEKFGNAAIKRATLKKTD
jgi:DNA polymerase IV